MSGIKWDVEKYRSPYESEEHWKLKRDFMLAHMDRIEEDRLVCLAQVYFNMELLGCRYPAGTMKEVNELAKEIGISYKEKKKNMLKRTFVPASDAAEAKVRGIGSKQPAPTPQNGPQIAFNMGGAKPSAPSKMNIPLSRKPVAFVKGTEVAPKEPVPPAGSKLPALIPQNGPQIAFNMDGAKPSAPSKNNIPLSRKPVAFVKGAEVTPKEPDPPANSISPQLEPSEASLSKVPPAKSISPQFPPAESISPRVPPAESISPQVPPLKSVAPQFPPAKSVPPEPPECLPAKSVSPQVFTGQVMVSKTTPETTPAPNFVRNPAIDEHLRAWDAPNLKSGFMLGPFDSSAAPPGGLKKMIGTQTEHTGAITTSVTNFQSGASTHEAVINLLPPSQPTTSFHRTMWKPDPEKPDAPTLDKLNLQKCAEEFRNNEDPVSEFIITTRDYVNATPINIMLESSRFCKIPIRYDFALEGNLVKCTLFIGNFMNVSVKDVVKKAAKDAASREALNLLRQKCWTIRILKLHAAKSEVTVEDVWKNTMPDSNKLGDNNIGNKMLKMMGWTGGGLGKDGTGIAEPIKLKQVMGRECLGANKTPASFTRQIDKLVNSFSKNPLMTDMAFSPEFSKEQRAEIHRISRKYRLGSHSHGSGANRFLVLTRKYSAKELVYKLLQEGGKHDKYVLIPPGGTDPV